MTMSWPLMLGAIGGLVLISLIVVWGVRVLARKDRDEEEASRISIDIATALAREPRLREAAILPVANIPLHRRASIEVTGRVFSASARDVALQIVSREVARIRPGMRVIDRLELLAPAAERRPA